VRDLLDTLRGHAKVETLIGPAKDPGKEPASAPSAAAPQSGAPPVALINKANAKP
jgi:hypothetical protein